MSLPGFTAERVLGGDQGGYSRRSTSLDVDPKGEVQPQLPPIICDFIFECCLDGNVGCCWFYVFKC